jgi:hypothetical protein
MTFQDVSIGVAATRSGVKVTTIRYYEQIGLLPRPPRTKDATMPLICIGWLSSAMLANWASKSRQFAPCSPSRTIQISHAWLRM